MSASSSLRLCKVIVWEFFINVGFFFHGPPAI